MLDRSTYTGGTGTCLSITGTLIYYYREVSVSVCRCLRHLYYPLLRVGVSKPVATLAVFTFSAIMHEVCLSIPFRHLSYHAFFGRIHYQYFHYLEGIRNFAQV